MGYPRFLTWTGQPLRVNRLILILALVCREKDLLHRGFSILAIRAHSRVGYISCKVLIINVIIVTCYPSILSLV
jgi:hypothetical protein